MKELREMLEGIKEDITTLAECAALYEQYDDLYDYFDDILDIEYRVSGDGKYRGVELLLTFGVPNIWIDTKRGMIIGAWGGDRQELYLDDEIINVIDEIFSEYYNSVR